MNRNELAVRSTIRSLQMEQEICPGAEMGSNLVVDPGSLIDPSKRRFLHAAGMLMAGLLVPGARGDQKTHKVAGSGHKVVVVVLGGVRRDETFSSRGHGKHSAPVDRPASPISVLYPCTQ